MIHVDFKDFQDMLSFARQLLGQVEGEKAMQPQRQPVMQQTPVVPTQPAAPATPVQPTAPVALAQPAAPTTPVQAALMAPVQATGPHPLHTRRMIWQELHLPLWILADSRS